MVGIFEGFEVSVEDREFFYLFLLGFRVLLIIFC